MKDPGEVENRAPAAARAATKGHPKWSLKTGSLTGSIETKPEERAEVPHERQMGGQARGAKRERSLAWRSLRYECSGG